AFYLIRSIPTFGSVCVGDHRHLHSFPTRRSSDLHIAFAAFASREKHTPASDRLHRGSYRSAVVGSQVGPVDLQDGMKTRPAEMRSEEHTSELQSRFDLVCRHLLGKK